MRRWITVFAILLLAWIGFTYFSRDGRSAKTNTHSQSPAVEIRNDTKSQEKADSPPLGSLPSDRLLAGYGDDSQPPLEDLKKLNRVLLGYFSVVKDVTRHPIGGNADLAAALLGENANDRVFIRPDHPALNQAGLLIDRWGTPLFVHPIAARELDLRSAGPDKRLFTTDDVVLNSDGSVDP